MADGGESLQVWKAYLQGQPPCHFTWELKRNALSGLDPEINLSILCWKVWISLSPETLRILLRTQIFKTLTAAAMLVNPLGQAEKWKWGDPSFLAGLSVPIAPLKPEPTPFPSWDLLNLSLQLGLTPGLPSHQPTAIS